MTGYVPRKRCDKCSTGRTGGVCTCVGRRRRGPADKVVAR
jgi:hypothetical protein